jgi:nitrite reductase (NADH) large subunit
MFEPVDRQKPREADKKPSEFVIIGGGIAGVTCAEEIRNNQDNAEITMVCAEALLPYYRLSLSRYLAGEVNRETLTIHPQSFYDQKKIKLFSGMEVTDILKDEKQVVFSDGSKIGYDKLIIANGAYPFVPPIAGRELANVITVRKMEDADFILEEIKSLESVICIGGGILGLEIAGAIAKSGVRVTVLEGLEWLMPRQLNRKGAEILKGYLKQIGIEVRENVKIQEITGEAACTGVKLSTGEWLPTRLVIITAGVRPNIHLVKKAGLEVKSGLVVNSHMQTSEENIFAAGDVTEHNGVLYGLWNAAQVQGKIAAQNAVGKNVPFEGIPRSAVLKVLGLDLFSIGEYMPEDDTCIQMEQEAPGKYILFVFREGKMAGSIVIGDKALAVKVKQAVEKGFEFPYLQNGDINRIIHELQHS